MYVPQIKQFTLIFKCGQCIANILQLHRDKKFIYIFNMQHFRKS